MNGENIKYDLQQILDNDLSLRQEFNTLKRSLSDYRNQLIMRDEDCKRLQVTIDVLNTKLMVVERDNVTYKSEIQAFKELRNEIDAQLEEKQKEIDERLGEIQDLKVRVNEIIRDHQSEIRDLRINAESDLENVRTVFENRLEELKNDASRRETDLKASFEGTITRLTHGLSETEAALAKKEDHEKEAMHLRGALEEQRSTLTNNFYSQVENLKSEFASRENDLRNGYESQLADLGVRLETQAASAVEETENRLAQVIAEYEEKLSNMLIHSNAQNSKLGEELDKARSENEAHVQKMMDLTSGLDLKDAEIGGLMSTVADIESQLEEAAQKTEFLNSELQNARQQASLNAGEEVEALQMQIFAMNKHHGEYTEELTDQISVLGTELSNMILLLEETTNQLSQAENLLEEKENALNDLIARNSQLEMKLGESEARLNEGQSVTSNNEEAVNYNALLEEKDIEFKKLLAENTQLINEIEAAYEKNDILMAQDELLRAELDEMKTNSVGKSEYFRETLSSKNFEITTLEAGNAALRHELHLLKEEFSKVSIHASEELNERMETLHSQNLELGADKEMMIGVISALEGIVHELNDKIAVLESAPVAVVEVQPSADEEFIDKLFKRIDLLNDEKLALLDEKEKMADQILKMTTMIGNISQQVDSEDIEVAGLNNHRKNVILANPSGLPSGQPMKEQINDLVREIDKCIALLSA